MYKSGPEDEKWTMPDLSSALLYMGLCKPGGMIRKYGGATLCSALVFSVCNNIQVGLSMRSLVLTDGMRHIVT